MDRALDELVAWLGWPRGWRTVAISVQSIAGAVVLAAGEPTGFLQALMFFAWACLLFPVGMCAQFMIEAAIERLTRVPSESPTVGAAASRVGADAATSADEGAILPALATPDPLEGIAGGSADREYARRRGREVEGVRAMTPFTASAITTFSVVAGIVAQRFMAGAGPVVALGMAVALVVRATQSAGHVSSYRVGAVGERRTAEVLDRLRPSGFIPLHDRQIPGRRENIDHIVVGPHGVIVVETKSYGGKISVRRGEITVDGRTRAGIPAQAERQAAAVRSVLRRAGIEADVTPVICIHRGQLQSFRLEASGVRVVGPRGLLRLLSKGRPRLSLDGIAAVVEVLKRELPPV